MNRLSLKDIVLKSNKRKLLCLTAYTSSISKIIDNFVDIILIGETRDPETAISSMDASETGHLVFTTLHSNTAASSLTRLLDMQVPKYKLNILLSLVKNLFFWSISNN